MVHSWKVATLDFKLKLERLQSQGVNYLSLKEQTNRERERQEAD